MQVACGYEPPGILLEQRADEAFGLVCDLFEALLIELPLGGCDQCKGLRIVVTLEGRLTTKSESHERQQSLRMCQLESAKHSQCNLVTHRHRHNFDRFQF